MDVLVDEVVVKRCLNGDTAAFTEIIQKYQKQIFSLCYRLTNNTEDAQDLAQESFLKIYQVLDKYDQEKPFFPWMYKVATNVCYTALRKRHEQDIPLEKVIEFAPTIPTADSQPEEYAETREVGRIVQKAIAELPENYRLPIILRYLEDFTYQQIAEIMDLPVSTIETRLFRGKSMLQKKLSLLLERGAKYEMPGN
ncbi:sigma-70 family RNA polymerase sigma factor [Bacillota bacterium LX-D]|nr:sigma-70 family RNA polymerase sigma factor [Bacillota bacterium LX-D]